MAEQSPKKAPLVGVAAEYQQIEQDYRRQVALVEVRPWFERVLFGAWWALDIGLGVVFFVGILWYLADGMFAEQARATAIFANAENSRAQLTDNQPQALKIEKPYVIAADSGATRFDLVAGVSHESVNWIASFTYQFTWSGGQSPEYVGFALPGETFYATALGVDSGRPSGAELQVRDVTWRRLDGRITANPKAWLAEHYNFQVKDEATTDSVALDAGKVSQTSFNLTNGTPYTYQAPEFVVLARRAGAPVGVTVVQVPQFEAASTRLVSIGWLTQLSAPIQVDVWPRIPFHDEAVYLAPKGSADLDSRGLLDGRR